MNAIVGPLLSLAPRSLRDRIIRGGIRFDQESVRGLRVKIAETYEELAGAARVTHDAWVGRGIMAPHPSGMKFHVQNVVPTSLTFVALEGDEVVGTISLLVDSALGVPMEATYPAEIAMLRLNRERFAEVGSLAVTKRLRRSGVHYLLNRIMIQAAVALGLDRIVIAVHPDAQPLYEAAMAFHAFGGERAYQGLHKSARAVALTLPTQNLHQRLIARFGHLGATVGNPSYLYFEMPCPWLDRLDGLDGAATVQPTAPRTSGYELLARKRTDMFRILPDAKLAFLRRELPGVLWPSRSSHDWSQETAHVTVPLAAELA